LKHWRVPVLMLVAFGLLLVIATAFGNRPAVPGAKPESDGPQIFAFEPGDVASITLSVGEEPMTIVKDRGGQWAIAAHPNWAVDQHLAQLMAQVMSKLKADRPVEGATNLADFGLVDPLGRVTVTLSSGDEHVLLVGGPGPILNDQGEAQVRYVKRGADNGVYMIDSNLVAFLAKGPRDIRDMHVVDVDADKVQTVHIITGEGHEFVVARDETGDGWALTEPVEAPADTEVIELMIHGLEGLRAMDIADENATELGQYGLDSPEVVVSLNSEGENGPVTEQLFVGAATQGETAARYVMQPGSPLVYTVAESQLVDLAPTELGLLVLKDLVPMLTDDLTAIEWSGAIGTAGTTAKVELHTAEDGSWTATIESPPGSDSQELVLDNSAVSALKRELGAFWASDVSAAGDPAGDVLGTLTLQAEDSELTLTIGTNQGGLHRVTRDDSNLDFWVSHDVLTRVVAELEAIGE